MTGHRPRSGRGSAEPADPEVVLAQALRAMAGGRRGGDAARGATRRRFTTVQILLMAAIVGLVVGMVAGIGLLLTR